MQNNYKYIYFTENISTTDFQVDLFSISNWFTQPDKYDSPFINNKIYKYLRFKNNITTTEFQTEIFPLSNWFSKPTEFPSPFINKPKEETNNSNEEKQADLAFSKKPSYNPDTKTLTFSVKNIGNKTTDSKYDKLYHYIVIHDSDKINYTFFDELVINNDVINEKGYIYHKHLSPNEEIDISIKLKNHPRNAKYSIILDEEDNVEEKDNYKYIDLENPITELPDTNNIADFSVQINLKLRDNSYYDKKYPDDSSTLFRVFNNGYYLYIIKRNELIRKSKEELDSDTLYFWNNDLQKYQNNYNNTVELLHKISDNTYKIIVSGTLNLNMESNFKDIEIYKEPDQIIDGSYKEIFRFIDSEEETSFLYDHVNSYRKYYYINENPNKNVTFKIFYNNDNNNQIDSLYLKIKTNLDKFFSEFYDIIKYTLDYFSYFDKPIPDTYLYNNGGGNEYDIYIFNSEHIEKNMYAFVQPELEITQEKNKLKPYSSASFMIFNLNHITNYKTIFATFIHEYTHSFQNSYNTFIEAYMESQAEFFQNYLTNQISINTEYDLLPFSVYKEIFAGRWDWVICYSNKSFGYNDNEFSQYSKWIFFEFLSEHYKKNGDGKAIQENYLIETIKADSNNEEKENPNIITNAIQNYQYDNNMNSNTVYTTLLNFWISMTTMTSNKNELFDKNNNNVSLYTLSRAEEYIDYFKNNGDDLIDYGFSDHPIKYVIDIYRKKFTYNFEFTNKYSFHHFFMKNINISSSSIYKLELSSYNLEGGGGSVVLQLSNLLKSSNNEQNIIFEKTDNSKFDFAIIIENFENSIYYQIFKTKNGKIMVTPRNVSKKIYLVIVCEDEPKNDNISIKLN